MSSLHGFVFALVVIAQTVSGSKVDSGRVDSLSWLSGCWEGQEQGRRYREQWMRPDGEAMLGMSQTVSERKMVAYEFLQIRQDPDGIYYVARPSGQEEAAFKLTASSAGEAIFENPQHDFPQRIIYRLKPGGGLVARTEGIESGIARGFDFVMRRTGCD